MLPATLLAAESGNRRLPREPASVHASNLYSMSKNAPNVRYAEVERETGETCVRIALDFDGGTRRDISTGIRFFDHMLDQMAFHGRVDIGIAAEGDLDVDDQHTVKDVGICLGQAIGEAVQSGSIVRYASNLTPMDDALLMVALDFSGRGQLFFDVSFAREKIGDLATENIRQFFTMVATHAGLTIHIRKVAGENDHHVAEAIFKGVGLALHEATRTVERRGPSSTKGKIG
jgi:imidazoleglycerol-phosphate dehydratase